MIKLNKGVRIAIVGGGKMGTAIMTGLIASDKGAAAALDASNFVVVEPGEERRDFLQERYGVRCVADVAEIERAHVVVLAVKPQVMDAVLASIADVATLHLTSEGPLFVSIAAGVTTRSIETRLGAGIHVVRTMPNMPLQVGCGATGVACGSCAGPEDADFVISMFECLGKAVSVSENDLDAVCALSGSGPAYAAFLIESMIDGSVRLGLSENVARELAVQTVFGAAAYLLQTGESPEDMRKAVSSPGGTTLAGLAAMEEAGFSSSVIAGMKAACERSKELGK